MVKFLAFTMVMFSLTGCHRPPTDESVKLLPRTQNAGEFFVANEDLPMGIAKLIQDFEQFPLRSSREEFEFVLARAGLKKQWDWYKDYRHYWYVDAELKPTIGKTGKRVPHYRITLEYSPMLHDPSGRDNIDLRFARIIRVDYPEPIRTRVSKSIWSIQYQ